MEKNKAKTIELFVSSVLHQSCQVQETDATDMLPLAYRKRFYFYKLKADQIECLIAEPVEHIALPQIRAQYLLIGRSLGLRCVLYLQHLTYYARDVLIREGIPFIWENHQVYLPFLGIVLGTTADRDIKRVDCISFLTQKMLLRSLYESWTDITATLASEKMQVSKMSVTRCFDEVDALNLPFIIKKGRSRIYSADTDKKKMWAVIRPIMRSPLITTFYLRDTLDDDTYLRSGYSALSDYSMLEDNVYPTYALTKNTLSAFREKKYSECMAEEEPVCLVQELGYQIPFLNEKDVDPLTVSLLISSEERADPRVDQAIDEMLENYVW